jgi:transposase
LSSRGRRRTAGLPPHILEQRLEDIRYFGASSHWQARRRGGKPRLPALEVIFKMKSSWKVLAWEQTTSSCYVGIDVSKASLDVCVLKGEKSPLYRRFANTKAGFKELMDWCAKAAPLSECHFCLESTGTYGLGIASLLSESGCLVSVENPRFIKHFAIGKRIQNKTDKADAHVIARYCRENPLRPWSLGDPILRELDLLLKRLTELGNLQRQEENRLECQFLPESIENSIRRSVKAMQDERELVIKRIEEMLAQLPEVQSMARAVFKESAVGELTALRVLAHMGWTPQNFEHAQ